MKLLLDTHLVVWIYDRPERLSNAAVVLIEDPLNDLFFSPISIWEVAIKSALKRNDFQIDPAQLRSRLLENGYVEVPVTGAHAAAVYELPSVHKDPFDRMLVAQATLEGLTLITVDTKLAEYPGPIRKV